MQSNWYEIYVRNNYNQIQGLYRKLGILIFFPSVLGGDTVTWFLHVFYLWSVNFLFCGNYKFVEIIVLVYYNHNTTLMQAGYVGEDVESILSKLLVVSFLSSVLFSYAMVTLGFFWMPAKGPMKWLFALFSWRYCEHYITLLSGCWLQCGSCSAWHCLHWWSWQDHQKGLPLVMSFVSFCHFSFVFFFCLIQAFFFSVVLLSSTV